jgi:hypothetical protein
MKVDFENAEAARREGQIGNCPVCAGKLERYGFMGLSYTAVTPVKAFG